MRKSRKKKASNKKPAGDELEPKAVRDSWDIDRAAVTSVTPVDGSEDLYLVSTPDQHYQLTGADVEALGLKVPAAGDSGSPRAASLSPVVDYDQHAPDAAQ
jgi:hypothetical protein